MIISQSAPNRVQATITITRDGTVYTHRLERNIHRAGQGVETVLAITDIDRRRARRIIEANPDGRVISGQLSFDARPATWTWQAEVAYDEC